MVIYETLNSLWVTKGLVYGLNKDGMKVPQGAPITMSFYGITVVQYRKSIDASAQLLTRSLWIFQLSSMQGLYPGIFFGTGSFVFSYFRFDTMLGLVVSKLCYKSSVCSVITLTTELKRAWA